MRFVSGAASRSFKLLSPPDNAQLGKVIPKFVLGRFLKKGAMSHDTHAPIPGAGDVDRNTSTEAGKQRLKDAIALFRGHSGELKPHVVYGPVDRARYERVHAMHIANHLA